MILVGIFGIIGIIGFAILIHGLNEVKEKEVKAGILIMLIDIVVAVITSLLINN